MSTAVSPVPPRGRHRSDGRRARRRDADLRRAQIQLTGTDIFDGGLAAGAETDPPATAGLGTKVRRGLMLSLLNTLIGRAGGLVAGIVLARLLHPADFGVFAVAMVALAAVLSLNELGVSLALVRWPGDPREIAPTVTTISVVTSGLLYVLCFAAAGPFASALGAPEATGVVRLLCLSVLIDGLTATPAQLLTREFRQGQRLIVDLTMFTLSTGLTIGLAGFGFGAWSLAWGRLAGNGVGAVVLFRFASLWPRPGFDRTQIRALLSFGLPLAGASLLVFAMLNVDYIVVGSLAGPIALGFYLQAFNLSSWPVNVFSLSVRRVSLAAFSRLQDRPDELVSALVRASTLLSAVTLPICALLGMLAGPIITTVYGQQWAPAAAALQWLAVLAAIRVITELAYDFLVAVGRSTSTMVLQAVWTLLLVATLPVAASAGGIRGVALAHAIVAVGVVLPLYLVAIRRAGVPLAPFAVALARPVGGAALTVAAVAGVRLITDPGAVQLVVGGAVGLAVYLPLVAPLRSELRGLRSVTG